ncbi:MAG: hypothetical protein A3J48_04335 [Candidatus Doudnabacteria bacterium RIFCSPHIGHO2_02_FULL_46_11]|uniref:PDZ domain-containing protein n=1 Tax=Candidatus Doudnabacteria bacterium RIFCSPHIGHO2_02_FULL_46_11 TaxID=1817832 RepID=A0A1F5P469_9BACT|nr:MAG: hypothetical protein A3J48_04335 [Candidatus Doudnabacteria bacterium RIFCSPHIGHO2_02_FULL_46_11]
MTWHKLWSKIRRPLSYGLVIFLVGGFGGLFMQKYLAPYLSSKPLFRNIGLLRTDSPLVITRTEQVRVNEGVKLIDLVKQLTPNVVAVIGGRGEPGVDFSENVKGSGVIISSDGVVASDKSFFADRQNSYWAVTSDGAVYPITILAEDPKSELVFVKIEDGTLSPVQFGISSELETGQQTVLLSGTEASNLTALRVSFISSAPGNLSFGEIYSSEDYFRPFALDADLQAGEGVFNLQGQLIGLGSESGIIPAEVIRSAQESFFAAQKIIRPRLGVNYSILTKARGKLLGMGEIEGIMLRSLGRTPAVVPGSPAAAAGLEEGDVIVRINGENVNAKQGLSIFLNRAKPGDTWLLTILRGGVEQEVDLILGEVK